ncbi:protein NLRC3-like isoform X2 [Cheilinus undulatus]|uniref:protein NLRC3-like isoform X2 n=1 Tax=Cheilinus undulatus TaxID=241271 RepID=UPI001BD65CA2|nr:protein NLRC3-like isoform X2 [Cheilinus undulatus]
MDQCEETDEGIPLSKTALTEEHEAHSIHQQRPESPESSYNFMRSDRSMIEPFEFKDERHYTGRSIHQQRPESPESSYNYIRGDRSMIEPFEFKDGHHSTEERGPDQKPEGLDGQDSQSNPTDLDSIFELLEETISTFVSEELKKFKRVLSPDYPEYLDWHSDNEAQRGSKEAFLKISLHFLRRIKQEQLADCLQSRTVASLNQSKFKSSIKKKFQPVFEGIARAGKTTPLNKIYTELYITEGGTGEVNEEHEVRQIEKASEKQDSPGTPLRHEDIFKAPPGRNEPIRTVMTKGVAGIGKTVLTQKFTLDWAEGKANQDIQFTFPFTFRELNVLKEKKFSLVELVHHFFPETKEAGLCRFEEFQLVFIFDGLDECRLPLDFHKNEILTNVTKSASLDVLLTNLIRGNLLPSARLWITTRPAAANQIPPECVDMVTVVRGFTDPKKQEYFRKSFGNEVKADKIISHIEKSRSLHIMCHIPVFCWITATVLEDLLKTREGGELPKTLTEMYIHFLVVQTKLKNMKYDGGAGKDFQWNKKNRKMIESLGKLAFEQLQKGNLIFYEVDLKECGIDIKAASMYSGVFTQVFREERGLCQDQMFSFIHLSVQEFLAALHVHQTFITSGVNLLSDRKSTSTTLSGKKNFYQIAVNKALQSPNGHLDLFLRFLLGLSLQENQTLLRGLVTQTESMFQNNQKTAKFIKKKITQNLAPERIINLFHCLNELKDHSLVEEIKTYLRPGSLVTGKFSPTQWSALGFILQSSEKDLDEFDLKKYSASQDVLLRLLLLVKTSKKALLSGCLITDEGCSSLASALRSNPSHLRELDLRYNHPGDAGVMLLSAVQEDPRCKLETLRVDHAGEQWLKPGLRKYACELTLDTNTVHRKLKLTEDDRKVTHVEEEEPYPDHPERFDHWYQLLCRAALTDRCYWEVEWSGNVDISVTYRQIKRKGKESNSKFAGNKDSWSLICSNDLGYFACHDNTAVVLSTSTSSVPQRVAVYVDFPAGTLSFYSISGKTLSHLHTFNTTFTEPLYPGFRLLKGASVSLSLL